MRKSRHRNRSTERENKHSIWLSIQAANDRIDRAVARELGMPYRWVEDADDTRAIDAARQQLRLDGFVNPWDMVTAHDDDLLGLD